MHDTPTDSNNSISDVDSISDSEVHNQLQSSWIELPPPEEYWAVTEKTDSYTSGQ